MAECVEHPRQTIDFFKEIDDASLTHILELNRDMKLCGDFGQRALSIRDEPSEFFSTITCVSFSDVRWYRYRGSPNLRSERESFFSRKAPTYAVDPANECDSQLPYLKSFETRTQIRISNL